MPEVAGAARAVIGIGEAVLLRGYPLAGVRLVAAENDDDARAAWTATSASAALVLLTPRAATAIGDLTHAADAPLTVTVPDD